METRNKSQLRVSNLSMRGATLIIFAILSCLSTNILAQSLSKEELLKLFADVAEDEKATIACLKTSQEEQIAKFGKPLPRISGHCYDGCPTRMPKPYYPDAARRNRIRGEVIVNAIVDETGKVIYAKAIKGNGLLRRSAIQAAYLSSYQLKRICGDRPIKFRWRIRYYFYPDM